MVLFLLIQGGEIMGVQTLLPIVEESYHQEQNALNKWDNKADNITRYVSIYLVLVNLLLSILTSRIETEGQQIQVFGSKGYLMILLPAIISLLLAIIGQALSRIGFLPDAKTLLKNVDEQPEVFKTEEDILQYRLMLYDELIIILRKNNRFKCVCVMLSYIAYMVSLSIFAVLMYNIL